MGHGFTLEGIEKGRLATVRGNSIPGSILFLCRCRRSRDAADGRI
jgi:hypothetical protein